MARLHRPLPVASSLRPTRDCRSRMVTVFRASRAAESAAISPLAPPPRMITFIYGPLSKKSSIQKAPLPGELSPKLTERLLQICSCRLSPTALSFPSCRKR